MGPLSAIDARGLTLRYGGVAHDGIDAVDLHCAAGDIVGVLGPNGAGKSTLLRVLATVLRPTSGTLHLLGERAVPPAPALRRRIGYAGDGTAHLAALSGAENVRFFARAAGMSRDGAAAAADELLRRLDLGADAGRPVAEYSYGMRRKLLLAATLAHAPELLILDEPTAGLDPPSLDTLRALLRERAAQGTAVVLATHDVVEAARVCHRVVFLHRGRAVLDGEPDTLVRRTGAATWLDIRFDAATPPELQVEDTEVVHADAGRVVVRSRAGTAALPALCAALLDLGASIRSIHAREPDLRDVFHLATGVELADGALSTAEERR